MKSKTNGWAEAHEVDLRDVERARVAVTADDSPANRRNYTQACRFAGISPDDRFVMPGYDPSGHDTIA